MGYKSKDGDYGMVYLRPRKSTGLKTGDGENEPPCGRETDLRSSDPTAVFLTWVLLSTH